MNPLTLILLGLFATLSVGAFGGDGKENVLKVFAMKQLFSKCIGEEGTYSWMQRYLSASSKCRSSEDMPDPDYNPKYSYHLNKRKPYPAPWKPEPYHYYYNPHPYYHRYGMPYYSDGMKLLRKKRHNEKEAEEFYWNVMKRKMKSKIGNMTCILKKMGYMSENNEVDYNFMKEEFESWPVSDTMKRDLSEGVDLCREMSNCIPVQALEKFPYGKEFGRTCKFFKCLKKTKIMLCMKKCMLEDYQTYKQMFGTRTEEDDMMEDGMDIDNEDILQLVGGGDFF